MHHPSLVRALILSLIIRPCLHVSLMLSYLPCITPSNTQRYSLSTSCSSIHLTRLLLCMTLPVLLPPVVHRIRTFKHIRCMHSHRHTSPFPAHTILPNLSHTAKRSYILFLLPPHGKPMSHRMLLPVLSKTHTPDSTLMRSQ